MTIVSASGKVLLAGGYLVLDPIYSGVVISTSSRFYSAVKKSEAKSQPPQIVVRSPQFTGATWFYDVHTASKPIISSSDNRSTNKFVQTALECVLALAKEIHSAEVLQIYLGSGLDVSIVGENDFYSQRAMLESLGLEPTLKSLKSLPRFAKFATTLADVHKTGLGSSAALITSLVSALLVHLHMISDEDINDDGSLSPESLAFSHNTAQYVHCLAQGKIGSGFDVSSAVFGSHIYTRFDPAALDPIMSQQINTASLRDTLSPKNSAWNHKVKPFQLPPYLRLMLADVDVGSDTPSLVGKVLKWRAQNPSKGKANTFVWFTVNLIVTSPAKAIWDELGGYNNHFGSLLVQLAEEATKDSESYRETLHQLSQAPVSQWKVFEANRVRTLLIDVRRTAEIIRVMMSTMGDFADVPIEPKEQTALVNACIQIPGVVCGGVPGAGGYDAIWVIVINTSKSTTINSEENTSEHAVEALWRGWKEMRVSPLAAVEGREGGLRVEDVKAVPGLGAALNWDEA